MDRNGDIIHSYYSHCPSEILISLFHSKFLKKLLNINDRLVNIDAFDTKLIRYQRNKPINYSEKTMKEKLEWKEQMFTNFSNKFGVSIRANQEEINQLLDENWELSKIKAAHGFKKTLGCFGIMLIDLADLSAWLPSNLFFILLGRDALVATSYVAIDYLSVAIISKILPPWEEISEQPIQRYLAQTQSIPNLIELLQNINKKILASIEENERAGLWTATGLFIGSIIEPLLFKRELADVAKRGSTNLTTLLSVFYVPHLTNPNMQILGPTPIRWQDSNLLEINNENEPQRDIPGLRNRAMNI